MKKYLYQGETLVECDHCNEQIWFKEVGFKKIPVEWLTNQGHNCDRPRRQGERHGPGQGRRIILKKKKNCP